MNSERKQHRQASGIDALIEGGILHCAILHLNVALIHKSCHLALTKQTRLAMAREVLCGLPALQYRRRRGSGHSTADFFYGRVPHTGGVHLVIRDPVAPALNGRNGNGLICGLRQPGLHDVSVLAVDVLRIGWGDIFNGGPVGGVEQKQISDGLMDGKFVHTQFAA